MKAPKPELQNTRILKLTRQFVLLPVDLLAAVYAMAKRLLGRLQLRSDKQRHAEDQVRQSRARRQLRGLTPDHVQETSKTS